MFDFDDEPQEKVLHRELLYAIRSWDIPKIESALSLGADSLYKSKVFVYTKERIPLSYLISEFPQDQKEETFKAIYSILMEALPKELPIDFHEEITMAIVESNSKELLESFLKVYPLKEQKQLDNLFKKAIFSLSGKYQLEDKTLKNKIDLMEFLLDSYDNFSKFKDFNVMNVWAKEYAISIVSESNYILKNSGESSQRLSNLLTSYIAKFPEVLSLTDKAITQEQKENLFLMLVRVSQKNSFFEGVIKADLNGSELLKIIDSQNKKLEGLNEKSSTSKFEKKGIEDILAKLMELHLFVDLSQKHRNEKNPINRF